MIILNLTVDGFFATFNAWMFFLIFILNILVYKIDFTFTFVCLVLVTLSSDDDDVLVLMVFVTAQPIFFGSCLFDTMFHALFKLKKFFNHG